MSVKLFVKLSETQRTEVQQILNPYHCFGNCISDGKENKLANELSMFFRLE